jgi:hypothetical protein
MAGSDFRRDLAEDFRKPDPIKSLRADWHYNVKTDELTPEVADWRLITTSLESIEYDFAALARRGGPKIHPAMESLVGRLDPQFEWQSCGSNRTRGGLAPDVGMFKELLADRFKLVAHTKMREQHISRAEGGSPVIFPALTSKFSLDRLNLIMPPTNWAFPHCPTQPQLYWPLECTLLKRKRMAYAIGRGFRRMDIAESDDQKAMERTVGPSRTSHSCCGE